MIYGFVQQTGGHVLLRSSEGIGTTVAIYLPRYLGIEATREVAEAMVRSTHADSGIIILLV